MGPFRSARTTKPNIARQATNKRGAKDATCCSQNVDRGEDHDQSVETSISPQLSVPLLPGQTWAQAPPVAILDIGGGNTVSYIDDVADPAKLCFGNQ
jgi:hypothetical protein